MFLLVPAYLGCPGSKAVKRLLLLLLLFLSLPFPSHPSVPIHVLLFPPFSPIPIPNHFLPFCSLPSRYTPPQQVRVEPGRQTLFCAIHSPKSTILLKVSPTCTNFLPGTRGPLQSGPPGLCSPCPPHCYATVDRSILLCINLLHLSVVKHTPVLTRRIYAF